MSGVARCGWPFEITRTAMSMSAGASCRPESVIMATGGATNAMPGSADRAGRLKIRRDAHGNRCRAPDRFQLGHQLSIGFDLRRLLGAGGADRLGADT